MNAQHTPGPWVIGAGFGCDEIRRADKPHDLICEFPYGTDGEDGANANLIAAAPELYEAAQDALDWIADSIQRNAPGVEQDDPPVAQLRAALAKARGDA